MAAEAAGVAMHYGAEVAAAGGLAAFAYNRGNYMFDNELRFERFTSGREFGCAQAGMYRKDLRKLTELTSKKLGLWCVSASLCMALDIALFCAGRLGLHGASPPGWIEALWLTNNAASFSFMILCIWLSMHASFRAQAASTHLLTRKVRVPVPKLSQLDKARRLASEFEQQDFGDIFRIPFLNTTGVPADSMPGDISPRHYAHHKYPRQASSWVRQEWDHDKAGTLNAGAAGDVQELVPDNMHLAPEHFRMYAAAQKEWWPYDAYARICLLYGFLSFVHGLGYYGLGHINIELRAFWVAYACVFVIMVLHALLLRFDIIRGRNKHYELLPNCQWLGPFAVLPAAIAMSLEFRVEYSESAIIISYLLQFLAIGMQLVYQIRLFELVLPDDFQNALHLEEKVGFPWWPDSWKVPSSFQHVLYLVAPPNKLAPGQFDLVRELKEGAGGIPMEGVTAGSKPMDPQEMQEQAKYLEELLQWAQSEKVFSAMSSEGQAAVNEIVATSGNAQREFQLKKVSATDYGRSILQSISALNAIMVNEGIAPQGLTAAASASNEMSPPNTPRSQGTATSSTTAQPKPSSATILGPGKPLPNLGMQHVEPWKLTAIILAGMIASWVVLLIGTLIEVGIGEQGLVTAPHWSRPPMTRASHNPHETGTPYGFPEKAGGRPWLPEQLMWHDEKRGIEVQLIGRGAGYPGIVRRLESAQAPDQAEKALRGLFGALPPQVAGAAAHMLHQAPTKAEAAALNTVLSEFSKSTQTPRKVERPSLANLPKELLSWPAVFEPKLLACGPGAAGHVAAVTPRGFGAAAPLGNAVDTAAEAFRLVGISNLPPLVGASWSGSELGEDKEGLLVMSRAGHLLHCPGKRPAAEGHWACMPASSSAVPLGEGARILAAAAGWLRGPAGSGGEPRLHAAMVDAASPDLVALYAHEDATKSWTPVGEMQVPGVAGERVSLSFVNDGELIVGSSSGSFVRRRLADGMVLEAHDASEPGTDADIEWQAACGMHGTKNTVAHLVLRRDSPRGISWRPEVIVAHSSTQGATDLVV